MATMKELLDHQERYVQIQARSIMEVLVMNGKDEDESLSLTLRQLQNHAHRLVRKLADILAEDMAHSEGFQSRFESLKH